MGLDVIWTTDDDPTVVFEFGIGLYGSTSPGYQADASNCDPQ